MPQPPARRIADPRQWLTAVPETFERLSPLYAHLYRTMQQDQEILALLALIDPDQPMPVLFFSVVTFLVLGEPEHPFARFYPVLAPTAEHPHEAYPWFRAFCLAHRDDLYALLPTARLQTNEVRRCAHLLPAFELVSRLGGRQPLALIEIGSSAGLNLNWFHYGYEYDGPQQTSLRVGDRRSPVQMRCALLGEQVPPLPDPLPTVAQCHGIELFPLDLSQERERRWLRSCIWPEEAERYRLLDAAMALAQQHPPQILHGDACDRLPELLASTPPDQTLCVWHSFALHQGPASVRERVIQMLVEASRQRTVYRISLEASPSKQGPSPRLELFTYQRGEVCHAQWLAECEIHGQSMRWFG